MTRIKKTEHGEQSCLIDWCERLKGRYPELGLIYAVPNGDERTAQAGARLKEEGVKKGVPDLFLPVRRWHDNGWGNSEWSMFSGLFIELKIKGNRLSPEQCTWLAALERQGFATSVCWSFEEARDAICKYLHIEPEDQP